MPAGRPTKYTPELIEKAWQYLTVWEQIGHKVPSNEGLAVYLEIGMRTLYDWEVDPEKPEFSHIIERLKAKRAEVLISNGLSGDFNSAITKLLLSKHGYAEKTETENKHEHTVKTIERRIIDTED